MTRVMLVHTAQDEQLKCTIKAITHMAIRHTSLSIPSCLHRSAVRNECVIYGVHMNICNTRFNPNYSRLCPNFQLQARPRGASLIGPKQMSTAIRSVSGNIVSIWVCVKKSSHLSIHSQWHANCQRLPWGSSLKAWNQCSKGPTPIRVLPGGNKARI